jgi:hypothetical protein
MSKIFTKVVGSTFTKNGQQIISGLKTNESLTLVREPSNQYDKNAIKILARNEPIGYVNAEAARSLAERMDNGEQFNCVVEQVTGGGERSWGCNFSLESLSDDMRPTQEEAPSGDDLDDILGI